MRMLNNISDERIGKILKNTVMINSNEYFQLHILICYLLQLNILKIDFIE